MERSVKIVEGIMKRKLLRGFVMGTTVLTLSEVLERLEQCMWIQATDVDVVVTGTPGTVLEKLIGKEMKRLQAEYNEAMMNTSYYATIPTPPSIDEVRSSFGTPADLRLNVGWAYIIRREGSDFYKIGHSATSGAVRCRSLQTASPEELILIGEYRVSNVNRVEKRIHKVLADCHVAREWFSLPPSRLKLVMSVLEALTVFVPPQPSLGSEAE